MGALLLGSSTCKWSSNRTGEKYDLSGLVPPQSVLGSDPTFRVGEYTVNVCAPRKCLQSGNQTAASRLDDVSYSYVCQTSEGQNCGTSIEFTTEPQPATLSLVDAAKYRFTLLYKNGDICIYDQTRPDPLNQFRKMTHIDFLCDLSIEIGSPELNDADTTRCGVAMQWRTRYACPVCTDAEYATRGTPPL